MMVSTTVPALESVAAPIRPQVDSSAFVHPLAQVMGDVHLHRNVAIAPGVSIRAEQATTFRLGSGTVVQEGAAIYGLLQGKVLGDDQRPYTVWIGDRVTLTHKVLVQGPVYIGEDCFIGFRSTVFNARLGRGCVVMMHALVQDVDIAAGKFVPSGAVITRQEQADQLPDVGEGEAALVNELLGGDGFRRAYTSEEDGNTAIGSHWMQGTSGTQSNERDGLRTMERQQLTPAIVQRARQYLSQGLKIGTEHADSRRFRSGVWQTCSPIEASRERDVMAALEACLAEHSGEYVRMFGIDTQAKQRVAPITIQRPDGKPVEMNGNVSVAAPSSGSGASYRPASAPAAAQGTLSAEVVQQVRNYLSQGYRVGSEHADQRRYRSNVWQTCTPIESNRESEVLGALQACIAEHGGEYVRMYGIDPQAKRRVAPMTIQRPDGKPMAANTGVTPSASTTSNYSGNGHSSSSVNGDLAQQVRQFLNQGYRVGAEYADQRRYRSNVWQTCPSITSNRESEVMAALSSCIAAHQGEYVRIYGIDPVAKRRVSTVVVQRPGESMASNPGAVSSPSVPITNPLPVRQPPSTSAGNGFAGAQGLSPDLVQQVSQLVNQGYRISLEHADQRRYRSGAWQTIATLDGRNVPGVLSELEARLQEHRGEYVRLLGIDPRAKRRVLETTIQRP
jgi:carbon dioxide concentrating mechanism protein CcmM